MLSLHFFCFDAKLIITEFRQLRRAEHRLVAHNKRWRYFVVSVLARMQVEHELSERAFESRKTFLQNHKTRTGKLRRGLEIHLSERFAQFEMLLEGKA